MLRDRPRDKPRHHEVLGQKEPKAGPAPSSVSGADTLWFGKRSEILRWRGMSTMSTAETVTVRLARAHYALGAHCRSREHEKHSAWLPGCQVLVRAVSGREDTCVSPTKSSRRRQARAVLSWAAVLVRRCVLRSRPLTAVARGATPKQSPGGKIPWLAWRRPLWLVRVTQGQRAGCLLRRYFSLFPPSPSATTTTT